MTKVALWLTSYGSFQKNALIFNINSQSHVTAIQQYPERMKKRIGHACLEKNDMKLALVSRKIVCAVFLKFAQFLVYIYSLTHF